MAGRGGGGQGEGKRRVLAKLWESPKFVIIRGDGGGGKLSGSAKGILAVVAGDNTTRMCTKDNLRETCKKCLALGKPENWVLIGRHTRKRL